MDGKITYFDQPGKANTEATLNLVQQRAAALGIKTVLVASTRGETAVRAAEILRGLRVIAVSHSAGFRSGVAQEFTEENRDSFEKRGGIVCTGTHLFAGLSRAMRHKHDMYILGDIVADVLRLFGQGMKVVCEIACMAADAGLVNTDEDVIAVGGSSRGADTAVVLTPVYSQSFFDMRIKEILCKPRF